MNLIEQLGGYEAAKVEFNNTNSDQYGYKFSLQMALLSYRRQHNIFDEDDKTVFVDDFMHGELMTVAWTRKGEVWMDEGAKRCTDLSMIRHATPAEIKAGRRL
ncbi:MAG: hypothetical protein RSE38_00670 [Acinetobacter sp.]